MNEFYTPPEFCSVVRRVLGEIDLDPASCEQANRIVQAGRFFSKSEDGFSKAWSGRVYLNPPSGRGHGRYPLRFWYDKLCAEYLTGRVSSAVFCGFHLGFLQYPARYVQPFSNPVAICKRKVGWVRPDGKRYATPELSAFVLLTHSEDVRRRFVEEFTEYAWVVQLL